MGLMTVDNAAFLFDESGERIFPDISWFFQEDFDDDGGNAVFCEACILEGIFWDKWAFVIKRA